jgi:UDPglucose 6-dehydrogenase
MKVFVQGLSHTGSVFSACLAELGHTVIAYDDDKKVIKNLKKGIAPIYEPGLKKIIKKNIYKKKLIYTNNLNAINTSDFIWFTYDPIVNDRDVSNILLTINSIKKTLRKLNNSMNVIISSQLPVGSIKKLEKYSEKKLNKSFNFYCCPENLRLGNSIKSFLKPARTVVGYRKAEGKIKIKKLLNKINKKIIWMSIESAEVTKHAINSFLGMSVSFINEIASICELSNANAHDVEKGLKSEPRIGKRAFLSPGLSFSGGTLGRDINYLKQVSKKFKLKNLLISSILDSNENHKLWIFDKLKKIIKKKKIKNICIWGFSYVENTDTLRRSLGINIAKWLSKRGLTVFGYDKTIKKLPNYINKISRPESKIKESQILIILAKDENLHKKLNKNQIMSMYNLNKNLLVIDPNSAFNVFKKYYKHKYIFVGKNNLSKVK